MRKDGYELVTSSKISGRDVFSWRTYIKKPDMCIPFSERNKYLITSKKICVKLPNALRHQLFKVMDAYDEEFYLTDETIGIIRNIVVNMFQKILINFI